MKTDPRKERDLKEVLRKRVERCGDKPWVVTAEQSYTYRDIDERSNRLGRGLAESGIRKGDTVLIMLPDTIDFIIIWCALAKIGAVEVPVNVYYKGNMLANILNDSLAKTMIVDHQYLERLEAVVDQVKDLRRLILYSQEVNESKPGIQPKMANRFDILHYEQIPADSAAPLEDGPKYHDLMGIMYTSGTTGPSKGGMITHAHAYEYANCIPELLEMKPHDIYYAPLPLFHIGGQWAVVYAACLADATAILVGTFSLSNFWEDVKKYKATCSFLLGAVPNFLLSQPEQNDDADNTLERVLMCPLIPEVEELKRRFGLLVSTTWGSTEVNCPMRSGFDLANNKTCGRVAEDRWEVLLVDENDQEVPAGVPGEALVRPKVPWTVMLGYWNHPEWTAKAWQNLWLHSGDLLMRDEQDNYYFIDRVKDAIRRRGENISSIEVENEINAHQDVLECAVIPVESEYGEQEVMAVIALKPGCSLDPADLIRFLEPRMAYFMVPRYVEIVDDLPKTPTGKIVKYPLRDRKLTAMTWDREAAGIKLKR